MLIQYVDGCVGVVIYSYSLARQNPVLYNYKMCIHKLYTYIYARMYIYIYVINMYEIVCMLVIAYLHRHFDIRHLSLP